VWSQQAELTWSDAGYSDRFGFSVALAKTTALIGAPGVRGGVGATYVFRESDDVWSQRAEETVPGSPTGPPPSAVQWRSRVVKRLSVLKPTPMTTVRSSSPERDRPSQRATPDDLEAVAVPAL
jgi:FG-GAP repeat